MELILYATITLLSFLVPKRRLILCGSGFGWVFRGNPKYFFLWLQQKSDYPSCWITRDRNIQARLKAAGLPVVYTHSVSGFFTLLRARYLVIEDLPGDVMYWGYSALGRFIYVQTFHGVPLKKIAYDQDLKHNGKPGLTTQLKAIINYRRYRYITSNSQECDLLFRSAFDNLRVYKTGFPRNDFLYNMVDLPESELQIDAALFAYFDSRTVIAYIPTWRDADTGSPFSPADYARFDELMQRINAVLVIKRHPYDTSLAVPKHLQSVIDVTASVSDIMVLLKHTDLLITDYSSVYFDFLHTEKPILFYAYDYQTYLQQCRAMYYSYDSVLPGPIVYTSDQLYEKLQRFCTGSHSLDDIGADTEYYQSMRDRFAPMYYGAASQRLFELLTGGTNKGKIDAQKRVLMLNYEFPPLGGGGGEVSRQIGSEMVRLGYAVDVVTMHHKELPVTETIDGMRIHRVRSLRRKKETCETHEMVSFVFSALRIVRRLVRCHKYEFCHTHFIIPTGLVCLKLKKSLTMPILLTAHGSDVPGYNADRFTWQHKFTRPLLRRIAGQAAILTTPSGFLAELFHRNIGAYPVRVIPNGSKDMQDSTIKKTRIIFSSGRLLPRKGFHRLIRSFLAIPAELRIGWKLIIAGDGPYRHELEHMADGSPEIGFTGWLNNESPEYRQYLNHASVFALPSTAESQGIVYIEAMSAGCAILASNTTGVDETVPDTIGLKVDPESEYEIQKALERLIIDNQYRDACGRQARKIYEQRYQYKAIAETYIKLAGEVQNDKTI